MFIVLLAASLTTANISGNKSSKFIFFWICFLKNIVLSLRSLSLRLTRLFSKKFTSSTNFLYLFRGFPPIEFKSLLTKFTII